MQEETPGPSTPAERRRAGQRPRPSPDASRAKERATKEAVDILWRALIEAETVLAGAAEEALRARRPSPETPPAADLQGTMRSVADYFGRVVDLMGEERLLLSQQVDTLSRAVSQLETQLDHLAEVLRDLGQPPTGAPTTRGTSRAGPAEEIEPHFAAGGEGVQLVISAVGGFQDLMDIQRALSAMPAIEGASVEGYIDGEARLVLHLREAVTARHVADALRRATGQEVAIDEARPEALRLRLRMGGAS